MFSVPLSEMKITKQNFDLFLLTFGSERTGLRKLHVCVENLQLDSWRLKFKWQFWEYGWWIIWKFWQLIVRSVSLSLRSAIECSFCLTSDIQEVCLRTVRTEASTLENFSRENLSYNFIYLFFFSRKDFCTRKIVTCQQKYHEKLDVRVKFNTETRDNFKFVHNSSQTFAIPTIELSKNK